MLLAPIVPIVHVSVAPVPIVGAMLSSIVPLPSPIVVSLLI